MPLTRGQAATKYGRLVKKIGTSTLTEPIAKALLNAATSTLELFEIPESSMGSSSADQFVMPEPKDVADYLNDMLPAPSEIFNDKFFTSPLFPVVVLYEISDLYGFVDIEDQSVLDKYRNSRGTGNVLFNHTLGVPSPGDHPPQSEGRSSPADCAPPANNGASQTGHPFAPVAPGIPHVPPSDFGGASFPSGTPAGIPIISDDTNVVVAQGGDPRKVTGIVNMFRDDKFNGNLSQSIHTTLRMYEIGAGQLTLTPRQKAELFLHVFDGPARIFFLNNTTQTMSYEQMKEVMFTEYNSDARQMQVKGKLETLRLKSYMEENEITDVAEGLSKLVEHIEELSPQCHPDFRSDTHRINYLRRAVAEDKDWSQTPIQWITSGKLSFNGFVTALHESIQNLKEIQQILGISNGVTSSTRHSEANETLIQQYGRNPRFVRKSSEQASVNKNGRTFEESRRRNECHKCGKGWRPGHRCEKGSIKNFARDRVRKGESSIHIISDLVNGLEGELLEEQEDDREDNGETQAHFGEPADLQLFDSLTTAAQGEEPASIGFLEEAEKEYITSHLSAAAARRRCSYFSVWFSAMRRDFVNKCRRQMQSRWKHRAMTPRHRKELTDFHLTDSYTKRLSKETRSKRSLGFCCDIGAPRSVVGRKELNRIFTKMDKRVNRLMLSTNRFRFADAVYESLGKTIMPLNTPPGIPPVMGELDVVNADIPALLGMDLLDKESLTPCTVSNRLAKRVFIKTKEGKEVFIDEWYVPMRRSDSGHLYADMRFPPSIFFTRSQLSKLHRQFFHPSATKPFNLLRRARPEEATPETLKTLEDLAKRCNPCQRIQNAPTRFHVTFGAEHARFNEWIIADIMYIDDDPVLHVVDEGTRFGASRFLPDVSTKTIWKALLECWATIYTGLPNRMLVDQGSQFGDLFINMAAASNVTVERTGVEAHSSLGIVERHHQPLRQAFRKIMISHPNCEKELALALAQKAMNDTMGPEGLVPPALVFGEYPKVHTNSEYVGQRATIAERAVLATTARKESESIMAEMRLRRALHHAVPPAADRAYQPGDQVLVCRDKQVNSRIGEWLGPFQVVACDEEKKLVYVRDCEAGAARPFNLAQVKPYFSAATLAHSFMMDIERSLHQFRNPSEIEAFLTEILDPDDERAKSVEMSKQGERRSWSFSSVVLSASSYAKRYLRTAMSCPADLY